MKWTDTEIAYLKNNYGKKSYIEIANDLGRTPASIKQYANRHDIKSVWTQDQDAYLETWYGRKTNAQIGKALGRTEKAVRHRATRLGLGAIKDYTDEITLTEVSRLLGKPWVTIYRWELKTKKVGQYVLVKPKDLFKFMQDNPDRYDATKCETWFFENESWFKEKLLQDRQKNHEMRWNVV